MYREEQLKALLEGHRILIAGYGREGRSAETLIQRLLPGAGYAVADGNEQIATESAKDCYDMIIKSPGVPMRVLDRDCWPMVTSLTDIFLQVYGDMTIGVTGTKGKSTTASLIHHLLPGSILAGNIGIPLFDILDELREDSTVVAELSCHQLEVLHRSPHVAVLLNLYQEHLDHYDDYMGYKMAKMQIGLHQRPEDHLFWCADAAELASLVRSLAMPGVQHPYSLSDITGEERELLESCPLPGEHNRSNALVACRVASLVLCQPLFTLHSQLSTFHGLRHRLELVGTYRGIIFYNDSISTIPAATIAALNTLREVDTLILGGFDRGIDYGLLYNYLAAPRACLRNIIFVGKAGRRMHDEMSHLHYDPLSRLNAVVIEDDYDTIVRQCYALTAPGKICLLSPAAASYDSFKNFEERGDTFIKLVRKYA